MYDEDGCHFRPLICLPNEKNYLPLEYGYLVGQIIEIKKHLPRSLKVVGIDAKKCCAKDYPPTSKIPLIAIDGIDINNGKQLSIYSPS